MPVTPKQSRKRVQFIERGRQRTAWLRIAGFEWPGPVRQGSKNESGTPIVGEAHIQFRARTHRRSRCTKSNQDVLAAVLKNRAISEGQRTALVKSNPSEQRPDGPQLGFPKYQGCMRSSTQRTCWQPHGGDPAGGGITLLTPLDRDDPPVH